MVWDWNGIGEDCGNSGIGIGDGSWVDFGDDGVGGLVEVADSASGAVDEDFDDVGVGLRAVLEDFDFEGFDIISNSNHCRKCVLSLCKLPELCPVAVLIEIYIARQCLNVRPIGTAVL